MISIFRLRLTMAAIGLMTVLLAGCARDDTDPPEGISGLGLYTDHATGCQYLSRNHSLTPRISADGMSHMGCKGVAP